MGRILEVASLCGKQRERWQKGPRELCWRLVKPSRPLLLDQTPSEWELGPGPDYRRNQLAEWLYQKRAASLEEMSNLPSAMRAELATHYDFAALKLVRMQGSHDTTRKLLWELRTGDYIESVLIPASLDLFGERSDRFTLCLSTQAAVSAPAGWRVSSVT
jgi:adenine C2-methylase RlmN of 23S rRNA A2503 and tRNA A37